MNRMKTDEKVRVDNKIVSGRKIWRFVRRLLLIGIFGMAVMLLINAHVKRSAAKYILTEQEAAALSDVDCVLVLGCQVWPDGRPSQMLKDRADQGIRLYQNGTAPKLLMSGDHGQENYDEVNTMKQIALDAGVPSSDIFMDHAGFSTYESMYRARDVFQTEKIVIVTQKYHLYRAVYIARKLGIDAYGVPSDPRVYGGQKYRDLREILARNKDFLTGIVKPKPKYLGEAIPVNGDGNLTDDKE